MNTYVELKSLFEAAADSEKASSMSAYMKDNFAFYGIPSPLRKELGKPFIRAAVSAKAVDWDMLDICFADEHREFQYFVNDYLMAMQRYLTYADVPKLLTYAEAKQWWDTIDFLDKIIGNIGLKDKRVDAVMLELSLCDDMWLRRLAIDHQNGRKDRTDTQLLSTIIKNNFGSDQFFINKAIGWALREYSKTDPHWVVAFVEENKTEMSKLSIKEALKRMSLD